jgi:hypothetical protein
MMQTVSMSSEPFATGTRTRLGAAVAVAVAAEAAAGTDGRGARGRGKTRSRERTRERPLKRVAADASESCLAPAHCRSCSVRRACADDVSRRGRPACPPRRRRTHLAQEEAERDGLVSGDEHCAARSVRRVRSADVLRLRRACACKRVDVRSFRRRDAGPASLRTSSNNRAATRARHIPEYATHPTASYSL